MSDFLKEFVTLVGKALEAEDRRIAKAGRIRKEEGGIRRVDQERFFQAVTWRGVYRRWPAKMEYNSHDLVIFEDSDYKKCVCVFEMKNWLEAGGPNVPEIREDITKLKNCAISQDSALVLFAANDRGATDNLLEDFEKKIFQPLAPSRRETYRFPIVYTDPPRYPNVQEQEFWISVWPIKLGPLLQKP